MGVDYTAFACWGVPVTGVTVDDLESHHSLLSKAEDSLSYALYGSIQLQESPRLSLVSEALRRGNTWFWWWPDGMKMSGFVGSVYRGRLIEVKP